MRLAHLLALLLREPILNEMWNIRHNFFFIIITFYMCVCVWKSEGGGHVSLHATAHCIIQSALIDSVRSVGRLSSFSVVPPSRDPLTPPISLLLSLHYDLFNSAKSTTTEDCFHAMAGAVVEASTFTYTANMHTGVKQDIVAKSLLSDQMGNNTCLERTFFFLPPQRIAREALLSKDKMTVCKPSPQQEHENEPVCFGRPTWRAKGSILKRSEQGSRFFRAEPPTESFQ